jgi:malonyl-CoA decarboxylase
VNTVWLKPLLDSIADRGRELLRLREAGHEGLNCEALCEALLGERGAASSLALAREILTAYQAMEYTERLAFFQLLLKQFGIDVGAVEEVARICREEETPQRLRQLIALAEPRRQELFRRLNTAPGGTAILVHLRSDLLQALKAHPELAPVDDDLMHLFRSWFNPGFLQLECIDWDSPARVLEKLIAYESVHEIRGWDDLRRRLDSDRRCFAFFHPALEGEPLIFVEVALVRGIAEQVQPLLDPAAPEANPAEADTAIFYSINNTQTGLRGISFGDFLIKRVVQALSDELPKLKTFATLSPLPRFAQTLEAAVAGEVAALSLERLDRLLAELDEALQRHVPNASRSATALALAKRERAADTELLGAILQRLALAYLTTPAETRGGSLDPVARFHLTNGARLERINVFADSSASGQAQSFGVMVNYLYDPDELVANHERFVQRGEIPLSRALAKEFKKINLVRSEQV